MWEPQRSKGDTNQLPVKPGPTIHFGILAVVLAVTMPRLLRSFSPTADPLDTSWTWMMGYALQHHLQWGKSVIFTYGPLGFLTDTYFYSDHMLWGLTATVRLASWFIFGLGFACIVRRLAPDDKPFPRTTLTVAIGWIVGASFLDLSTQSAVLAVLLLVLAITEEDGTAIAVELIISGSLLALGALVKSTGLIMSLFALVVYPALWCQAGRRKAALRSSLILLPSFFVSFCVLWLVSSQSFANLPAYFRGTWEIVRGYTAAMAITGWQIQILSALAILSLFAAVLIGFQAAGKKARVAQCLLLGGMAFWAWKEGFTLQDPGYVRHPMTFYGTALLIASVGTVLLSTENPRYLRTCVYGAYAVALLSSILGYPPTSLSYTHVLGNYKEYFTLIFSESHRMAEQRAQTRAIQKQFDLPNGVLSAVGQGSVNVMPWALMITQGYGMRVAANPVIQSYSVYTPYLDQINARQIWEGRSSDKIIFTYAALGRRYPPFDEPATFRALLTCYRTEYPDASYVVLSHATCAPPEMLPADTPEEASFGRWVRVPQLASYVDIDVRPTVVGNLQNIVYKAKPVWVMFGMSNGAVTGPYQLIYPVAKDGLFIRYFIGSESDVAHLFSGNVSGMLRIAAFLLITDPRSSDYAKHFGVRFVYENPPHRYLLGNAGPQPSTGERPH